MERPREWSNTPTLDHRPANTDKPRCHHTRQPPPLPKAATAALPLAPHRTELAVDERAVLPFAFFTMALCISETEPVRLCTTAAVQIDSVIVNVFDPVNKFEYSHKDFVANSKCMYSISGIGVTSLFHERVRKSVESGGEVVTCAGG